MWVTSSAASSSSCVISPCKQSQDQHSSFMVDSLSLVRIAFTSSAVRRRSMLTSLLDGALFYNKIQLNLQKLCRLFLTITTPRPSSKSVAGSGISTKKGTAVCAILRPTLLRRKERRAVPLINTKETRSYCFERLQPIFSRQCFSINEVTQLYATEDVSQRKKIKNIAY